MNNWIISPVQTVENLVGFHIIILILLRLCEWMFVLQFQTELRKILVSLIEVAQKLLALNPDAVELFKKANGKAFNPLKWVPSQ